MLKNKKNIQIKINKMSYNIYRGGKKPKELWNMNYRPWKIKHNWENKQYKLNEMRLKIKDKWQTTELKS